MSTRNTVEKFWSLVQKHGENECWFWTGKQTLSGHAQWYWKGKVRMVHHISMMLYLKKHWPTRRRSDGSDGVILRHTCDCGVCVNPRHLVFGTQLDNIRDKVERGRTAHNFKLSPEDVLRIGALFKSGKTKREIAVSYNMDESWIGRIINNKAPSWTGFMSNTK